MARLAVRDGGTSLFIVNGSTNGVVDTGFHPTFMGTSFSIACWAKPSAYKSGANNESSLWGVDVAGNSGAFAHMNDNAGGQKCLDIHINAASLLGTIQLNPGTWYHTVITFDGTTIKSYINGVLDINNGASWVDNAANLFLMARTSTVSAFRPWAGYADDFILFNKALSQADVNTLYYTTTIPSGATNRWKFDEGSGTTALDSIGTNNGTIANAAYSADVPMIARTTVANRFALPTTPQTALSFSPGTTNQVLVKSTYLLAGQTNSTISAWIRGNGSTNRTIYSERAGSGNDIFKFEIQAGTGKLIFLYRDDAGTLDQPISNAIVNDRRWHQVIVVKTGTSIAFYIDGVASGTGTLTATNNFTDASPSCLIGKDVTTTNETFDGSIKDVRLFTRAVSALEITALAYNSNAFARTNLVGEYLTNEGAGTVANDTSGNGNTGTITGATYTTQTPFQPRTTATSRLAA